MVQSNGAIDKSSFCMYQRKCCTYHIRDISTESIFSSVVPFPVGENPGYP